MSLTTPDEKVQKLRAALGKKAKDQPDFRFYALYDKVYRPDVLRVAYERCQRNDGSPGVDGQTFKDIEAYGVDAWLGELAQDLREKSYQPSAVKRVMIPKANGKLRPLGIPTIRDRVAQTAVLIVLEPIFEADLPDNMHAYRPGHHALGAVDAVFEHVRDGYTEVVDADLSGYFDTIPHAELMKCLARRIVDRALLHLIKLWLVMPVEETDDRGHRRRSNPCRRAKRGTPQGAPISPLLANLYMRRFVVAWERLGYAKRFHAKIVNYADDFVICSRGHAEEAACMMRQIMAAMKLTVNDEKTRVCDAWETDFEFLGYQFGKLYSPRTGRAYFGARPSPKKIASLREKVHELTEARTQGIPDRIQVGRLNRLVRGWSNYFCRGTRSRAYRVVDHHVRHRLRQWLKRKHKIPGNAEKVYPDARLHEGMGLVRLS